MNKSKKNVERMVRLEKEREAKRERRLGPRPQIKNPLLHENERTKVFNLQIKQNIGLVMADMPVLLGRGINITRASVRPDFSEVLVFWVSQPQEEAEVGRALEEHVAAIRRAMIDTCGLGHIPKITFVRDLAYIYDTNMSRLFSKLDTGPEPGQAERCDDQLLKDLEALELGTDGLGLQRKEIMLNLVITAEKSLAKHRYEGATAEQFNRMYTEAIEKDDGAKKIIIKKNIQKFLSERKKATHATHNEGSKHL